jgi:BirA family transcriptional regulator, biotin operon repressor / biotin---[acetyl-CoA-carboxylase] ligase
MDHPARFQHGDVVFTRRQTAGRGQQGRIWYAPPGTITASFILDRIPVSQLSGLSLAAGLATIYAIEDLMTELEGTLQIKWPNDVLIRERKVAGILCEATSGQGGRRVVVGIGLNRRVDFTRAGMEGEAMLKQSSSAVNPISLHEVSHSVPDELPLLMQIRHYLLQVAGMLTQAADGLAKPLGLTPLLPELHRRDVLLNRNISLELEDNTVMGKAVGISPSGQLLLRLPDRQIHTFSSGRVRWHS